MNDDTILMVMGDHGMSSTGDHGGDTHNEITSMLFMYSKGVAFNTMEYSFGDESLQQIDLVPTLAAILGVPSPYSNLGIVNLHLLPVTTVDHLSPYQVQLLHLWHNAQQIQHYFQKYTQHHRGTFETHSLDSLEHTYVSLSHRVNTIYSETAFLNFAKDVRAHLKQVLLVCRGVWVKFDAQLMSQGMLITFITTFLIYVLVNHVGVWQLPRIFGDKVLGTIYLSNSVVAIPSILFYKEFGMSNETHSILFFTSILSFGILGYLIVQNWPDIALAMSQISRYGNVIARFVFTFSCGCFFSNSYLVEEQRILGYLLISLFIFFLYQLATTTTLTRELRARFRWSVFFKSIAFKLVVLTTLALLLLRMSFFYFRCREEQENCMDAQMKESLRPKRRSTRSYDLVPVIVLGFFATLSRIYLRSCGNLTGYGVHTMLARFGPTLAAVCAGGHFVLTKTLAHDIKLLYIDALAWVIYALFAAQLLLLAANPLLVYVLPKRSGQVSINEYANVIPELYRKLKQNYGQSCDQNSDVPIVCGLATVYSSIFVSLATVFGLLLCLLLGPQPSTGFVIVVAIAIAVIVMNSVIRYETASTLERSLQPQFVTLVAWLLLAQFGFYATSHQPTMSQIDWSSAFIGRTMHFDHSMLLSAILVILNTFCSSFFFGLLYPLMLVAPFCLYSIWPTLSVKVFKRQKHNDTDSDVRKTADNVEYRRLTVNKSSGDGDTANGGSKTATLLHVDFDVTRGEVNLFENETVFLASAFKTGCQLLMLQGIRVSCSMLASTILCRHLMVWKIFAPRFIYEGISSYAIFISIIFGYAILIRIHSAVCELVDKLNKTQ
jgi:GPI ethanolamine phosphate transferase 3 subunit O